jgi:drug/metabolite transporter (DMT)-like permease
MKVLLDEVPPFTLRAVSAAIGVALVAALLNVTAGMGLASFSLLWLAAGKVTIVCCTMPVWASVFAWIVLGARITARRALALAVGFAGLLVLVLGEGLDVGVAKVPGVGCALAAALLFSLGTVITKRWLVALPPASLVAWQTGLGCLPLLVGALIFARVDVAAVSTRSCLMLLHGGIAPLGLRELPALSLTIGGVVLAIRGWAKPPPCKSVP